MSLNPDIINLTSEMTHWRHDFHKYPEIALQEKQTSKKISELLKQFGFDEVIEKIDGNGIIGVLRNGDGPTIGLVAALDGQDIQEKNENIDYPSENPGCMHAIGNDGCMAMLLGASKYLSQKRNFNGTVVCIFCSNFASGLGTRAMVEDGLFERFPISEIYSFQSVPKLSRGKIAVSAGPFMGAVGELLIKITGESGYAAFPNKTKNPVLAGAAIVNLLELLASSYIDPAYPLSLCMTSFIAGNAFNHVPQTAELKGSVRFLYPVIEKWLPDKLNDLIEKISQSYEVKSMVSYRMVCPAIVNTEDQARFVRKMAREILGDSGVEETQPMTLLGNDFAYFLQEKKGVCIPIGNGNDADLMSPNYDFADDVLPIGASLFVNLAEKFCNTNK